MLVKMIERYRCGGRESGWGLPGRFFVFVVWIWISTLILLFVVVVIIAVRVHLPVLIMEVFMFLHHVFVLARHCHFLVSPALMSLCLLAMRQLWLGQPNDKPDFQERCGV
jgi:hypothetical protein